jgi:pyruvate kinase
MVVFSKSGSTARRIARERPPVPILAMSPSQTTSRRMGLYWGVHSVHSKDVSSFE